MDHQQVETILRKAPELSILVVGDFFLDKYLLIDAQRDELSLETDLTAYQVTGRRLFPGAAGTVAKNLKSLGVGRVAAVGFIGDDGEGKELVAALADRGVETNLLIVSPDRQTPTYVKPMRQENGIETELNRLDMKNFTPTSPELQEQIIGLIKKEAALVDAIVVLDQILEAECGVVTTRVREAIAELAQAGTPPTVYADSRARVMDFEKMIVKCNHLEAAEALGVDTGEEADVEQFKKVAKKMVEKTGKPVFLTMGKEGLLAADRESVSHVPGVPVEGPIDICGAGDATTSGIVTALAAGASLSDAGFLGNTVASIAITKINQTGEATPDEVRMVKFEV